MNHPNKFKDWEIAFIRLTYPEYTGSQIGDVLNRSKGSVTTKARQLKIKHYGIWPHIEQRFGDLVVLEIGHRNIYRTRERKVCLCKCDRYGCDKQIYVASCELFSGRQVTCGCKRRELDNNIPICFIKRYIKNAKKRNLKFFINGSIINATFINQKSKCKLSGLDVEINNKESCIGSTASIDRIDSNKDYTSDNIQIVHKDIQKMKNDLNQNHFISMCKLVSKNNDFEYDDKTNDWW